MSEADLPAANGRLQGIEWVSGSFVGPPIGAALFVVATSLPFFLNAASFALAALFVVAPRMVAAIGSGNTLRVSVGLQVIATLVVGLVSNAWIVGVVLAFYGFLIIAWNVVSVSLRQGLTPDEMRGRVAGAARLLAWGSQPLGALTGGWVAATLGLRAPFFVAAAAFAVMLILTWTVISNQSIEAARSGSPVT